MNKNEQLERHMALIREAGAIMAKNLQEIGRQMNSALAPLREAAKTPDDQDLDQVIKEGARPDHLQKEIAQVADLLDATDISVDQWVELRNLCLEHLKPPRHAGDSWTLNPNDLAEAIVKLGWRPT